MTRPGFAYSRSYRPAQVAKAILFTLLSFCAGPALAEMFGPISGQVYSQGNRALVLVIHGDSGPKYLTGFAQSLARQNPGATVIQMARPGYAIAGKRSKGTNSGKRDHYTKQNNKYLTQGISQAAQKYPHKELLVVSYSGGSAQVGTILGTAPGLVDTAIMVAGPFDIPRWRSTRGNLWPKSQSPIRYLDRIPKQTRIIAATGSSDANTLPGLARDYVKKAQARGLNATFVSIPNVGHSFSALQPAVLKLANQEIRN